jgi:predicted RNase H-like nuclease
MTIETLIGFDSAWTDKNPGAISMITHNQGKLVDFMPPRLVRFEEATEMVQRAASASDFTLIALDQPTLVPSFEGMRPVERVVGSVVNAIGGGVQPANRSRESMFGQGAPVWQFLDRVGARENPTAAREASHGLFLIEVFPALALASIIPTIWHRRRAAKYNPGQRKTFVHADWGLVTDGIASLAQQWGVQPIMTAANELGKLQSPTKSDQDKLDALICLMIAWTWRFRPREDSMLIGDSISGYIVTPVSGDTRPILVKSALRRSVPVDSLWGDDGLRTINQLSTNLFKSSVAAAARRQPGPSALQNTDQVSTHKICPECGKVFTGKGWGGIDAHWRVHHDDIMPYNLAWPIIKKGGRPSMQKNRT